MKDAYSFDADDESLENSYQAMAQAYRNIYERCGLPALMVEADSGAIGGKDSHEFILPTPSGEDVVLTCSKCGYAANTEKAGGSRFSHADGASAADGGGLHARSQDHSRVVRLSGHPPQQHP